MHDWSFADLHHILFRVTFTLRLVSVHSLTMKQTYEVFKADGADVSVLSSIAVGVLSNVGVSVLGNIAVSVLSNIAVGI